MVLPYKGGDIVRLLIAHPSASFAGKLREALEGEFEISWVSDGAEALEQLNRLCPEMLVLHLSMPRKDGFTILAQAAHFPEILIATTDYLDSFVAAAVRKYGGVALVMPMVSTVARWVYELLEQSRLLLKVEPFEATLHRLGFRPSLMGYSLLCTVARSLKKDPGQKLSGVYGSCGEIAAVEKAIRTAIHTAWREGERQVWKKYFGADSCPSNRTFLLTLLQPDLHGAAKDHTVFGDSAIHGQKLHAGLGSLPQGSAEGGIGGIVGVQPENIRHLDHEEDISAAALLRQPGQSSDMPGAPRRRCVGEGTDAILLQGDALDL